MLKEPDMEYPKTWWDSVKDMKVQKMHRLGINEEG